MSVGRIITSDECVAEGAEFLAQLDDRFKFALEATGKLPLRLRSDGFPALMDAIVSQQISVAAAKSISLRLEQAGLMNREGVLAASEEALAACGLSRPKVRYAKSLAESSIDYSGLKAKADFDVMCELTSLIGIGTWTAEIYAMFSLGRKDVFPSGDLALQEATKVLFDLKDRPNEKQMAEMASAWSPWRAVAARLLWAYYRVIKDREGIKE